MKKIALINGSPKMKNSNSGYALKALESYLADCTISEYDFHKSQISDLEPLCENEILVFAFPLYVDGIPSQMLNCLYQMEQYLKDRNSDIHVYAIANCGFYEGHQTVNALSIMENWCVKSHITWEQGIGVGGGGMLSMVHEDSPEKGFMKDIVAAMKELSRNILETRGGKNIYVNPNFPRILYKIVGELSWRREIKANGLKRKDLFRQK